MSPEQVEVLILGSGQGGKLLAWQMAQSGRRTTVVERRWVGGPNIACMPSKNEVWSARVAYLAQHARGGQARLFLARGAGSSHRENQNTAKAGYLAG